MIKKLRKKLKKEIVLKKIFELKKNIYNNLKQVTPKIKNISVEVIENKTNKKDEELIKMLTNYIKRVNYELVIERIFEKNKKLVKRIRTYANNQFYSENCPLNDSSLYLVEEDFVLFDHDWWAKYLFPDARKCKFCGKEL